MMDECFRRTDRQSLLLAGCVCLYRKLEEWEREFHTSRRKEGRQCCSNLVILEGQGRECLMDQKESTEELGGFEYLCWFCLINIINYYKLPFPYHKRKSIPDGL